MVARLTPNGKPQKTEKNPMTNTSSPPRNARLIPAEEVFANWRKDPGYREAYDALEEEFAIMSALIKARSAAGLSQSDVAKR